MEFLINETTKWNVVVPAKTVKATNFTINYTSYVKDVEGMWQLEGTQSIPLQFPVSVAAAFSALTPYEQIIYVIKLLVPDFLSAEDKLKVLIQSSTVPDTLKITLITAIDSAITKYKTLKEADMATAQKA